MDKSETEVLAEITEGKLFGQIGVLLHLPRFYSIFAKTNCDLFVLNKYNLEQLLKFNPHGKCRFCFVLSYVFTHISYTF